MSSAVLQWIALLAMVTDHVGYAFFPGLRVLRSVGRLSFPIFAFLLSQGFTHTSNRRNYALRLFLFGLVSEVPYQFLLYGGFVHPPWKNILFALLLSFFAMWCLEQGGVFLLGSAAAVLAAEWGGFSYGAYGVLLTLCFFECGRVFPKEKDRRKEKVFWSLSLAVLTLLYCLLHGGWFQIWAALAAVPLLLYNGERGKRLPRYFLYAFYPAHLAVLVLLRQALPF